MPTETLHADYVVVGAGSAGSVVARRLADAGATVIVLEAGGRDTSPAIHDPLRMHELWHTEHDWDYHTVPQRHAASRRLHIPRGRVLGGSHALNATIYVRGNPADYDHWADLGNAGWAWRDVEPLFRRIERTDGDDDGMLDILTEYSPDDIQQAIVSAAQECGIPFNENYNGERQEGVGLTQLTISAGRRRTTADAYLKPASDGASLRVLTGAHVHRLLQSCGRAYGVTFIHEGRMTQACAHNEVVLAAGTIGSATLLQRSGIGPAEQLRAAGIDVTVDLPDVGRNLADHWLVPVIFSADREVVHTLGLPPSQTHLFWRSNPAEPVPDLQPLHFSTPLYEPWMSGPANGFTLMAGVVRPASVGEVFVTSPELEAVPRIDPNVLSAPSDMDRLCAAVELCQAIGNAPALRGWGATERYPGYSDHRLPDYIRRTVVTYHHQVGTCRMGTDGAAVVDPGLRVRGVSGLRVADASIMPTITTGNTNAPTVLIAEKAATLLLADGPDTVTAGGPIPGGQCSAPIPGKAGVHR